MTLHPQEIEWQSRLEGAEGSAQEEARHPEEEEVELAARMELEERTGRSSSKPEKGLQQDEEA